MQKTPSKIHHTVVFIGFAAALALCTFSCIALGRARPPRARPSRSMPPIEELDALAKPHFDEAERNVSSVVAEMSTTGNFLKFCWFIMRETRYPDPTTRETILSR